jgi:hypothetical protein
VSKVFQEGSLLHSAKALSKLGLGYLVARIYVFFATLSRAPESVIACAYVPTGCGVSFEST